MTTDKTETILREELHRVAPDIDLNDIGQAAELREEMDIDSMDLLTLITALGKRLNIAMPEADYPLMASYNDLAHYLKHAGK